MERKVTKLEHSHVEVVVTVDEKTWKVAQKKAFDKEASNVQVQGFRKGKAPENLVKSRINQVKVMDDAINALLPTLYRDIMENEDVRPYAQPKVDVTKLSDTELEVKFTIVTKPTVELGAYKGLAIGHDKVEVTDKDVEDAINGVLAQSASLIVKDGAAENGDTVVMDFVGTCEGVQFEGGSATNHELELGSHTFIPGFEEQLIGAKAGDHVDVNVTFPEQYVENLKGKPATFACDIHEVKSKKLPELNDEFVKEQKIAGVETVDAYKENVKANIKLQKEANEKREYLGKVTAEVAKNSKVDIPDEIIDAQVASRREDFNKRLQQSGLTIEQYLQYVGQKEEDVMKQFKEDSLRDSTNYFILEEIATAEKIEISDADLDAEMAKIADQYKMKIEDVKKALAAQLDEFRNNLKMQKVEELLLANNK